MFFELSQVERMQSNIQTLSQLKQTLDRKCLQSMSSNPQKIEQSMKKTLSSVLADSQKTLSVIKDIQDQIQMDFFIPSSVNVEDLVYDSSQLPEWFDFVFKKQYEKQKKNLDGLCKKAYKIQALNEVRFYLQKDVQSFRLLVDRYSVLNSKEKKALNIMSEADVLSCKCRSAKEKYNNFCKIISTKIVTFLEQSVSKSLNFSNSMTSMGQTVTNSFNVKLQPQQFDRNYLTSSKFRQTTPTFQTNQYSRQRIMVDNAKIREPQVYGKTMYNRLGSKPDFSKTAGSGFGGTYVPRYVANTTLYDFYR